MTLTEYINQENPVWGNVVYLEPNEYIEHFYPNENLSLINIPIIYEKYGLDGMYIMYKDCDILYTQDDNGKPKKRSVFRILLKLKK